MILSERFNSLHNTYRAAVAWQGFLCYSASIMAKTVIKTGIKFSPIQTEKRAKLALSAGDTVRVFQKVEEKGKTRLQVFEGLVLARKHGNEPGATFTVRKVSSGVGVEKIFPLYSPMIDKIEIVRRSKVRRAKLYFIREKVAHEIRKQMRTMRLPRASTDDETEENEEVAALSPEETTAVIEETNKEKE